MKRVVITGLGGVTPIGIGADEIWENAVAGRSGIGPITMFDVASQKCRIAGEVKAFDAARWMPAKHLKRMDDFARYAVAAAVMAVDDAGLPISQENSQRIGTPAGLRSVMSSKLRWVQSGTERSLRLCRGAGAARGRFRACRSDCAPLLRGQFAV